MRYLPLHPENVDKRPVMQADKWLIEFYYVRKMGFHSQVLLSNPAEFNILTW